VFQQDTTSSFKIVIPVIRRSRTYGVVVYVFDDKNMPRDIVRSERKERKEL
jgi:hypothetical protein